MGAGCFILLLAILFCVFISPVDANPRYWCGGNDNVECPSGYVCNLKSFNCAGLGIEQSDIIGVCMKTPEKSKACPLGTHKVCSCHGNTYDNDCERVLAGEIKSADGECDN